MREEDLRGAQKTDEDESSDEAIGVSEDSVEKSDCQDEENTEDVESRGQHSTAPASLPQQSLTEAQRIAEGCSICLESFQVGETAMQSVNPEICPHLFHETCILNWLVSRQLPVCPCCRQPFVNFQDEVGSPYKLVTYQQELLAHLGPDDV